MSQKRVGVLLGGESSERAISLKTGRAVFSALKRRGHDVVAIDVGRDLPQQLLEAGVEVAFIALHGVLGEDGCVQGLLEVMGIPYTGSGVTAAAVAMDKQLSKEILVQRGIPTPPWVCVRSGEVDREALSIPFPYPMVVKPNTQGSTVGIHLVPEARQLSEALEDSGRYDDTILVEAFIPGDEVTVGMLNGEVLPVVEIVPPAGFFDFEAKYTKGTSQYHVPARISPALMKRCHALGGATYAAIGCEGVARVDIRITPEGACYVLEINTVPGMTETSLIPMAAAEVGKTFEDVCEVILASARLKVTEKARRGGLETGTS